MHMNNDESDNHWELLRDVLAFQLKLALDGLRDVLLIPVSMITLIVGAIKHPKTPGVYFYRLLHLGRRSDRLIDLFGEHEGEEGSTDSYISKVEAAVVNQYQKGGLVKELTDKTDQMIGKLQQPTDKKD
jgi:hypothetical protein|tara:strand:+ start:2391 stop:2777 length:387 start_codon:yes stop_codon:yes gene_type:complete